MPDSRNDDNLFVKQWNKDKEEIERRMQERNEVFSPNNPLFEKFLERAERHMSPVNTKNSDIASMRATSWKDFVNEPS